MVSMNRGVLLALASMPSALGFRDLESRLFGEEGKRESDQYVGREAPLFLKYSNDRSASYQPTSHAQVATSNREGTGLKTSTLTG